MLPAAVVAFVLAFVLAFAFLSVIPEGNLLLLFPQSLLPIPYSLFPAFLFPVPCSLFLESGQILVH
ncbi:MAG: hypothetical protein WBW68_08405, partial [Terracidiphilus sp.]